MAGQSNSVQSTSDTHAADSSKSDSYKSEPWRVRVLPKRTLSRNGILSYILISVPLFGALYLLCGPEGTWPIVLVVQVASVLLFGFIYLRYRLTFIGATANYLVERGFLGRIIPVPLSEVESIVLVETYRTNAPDTTPQLVVRGAGGARLLRMRGIFWSRTNMKALADAIDRPLTHFADPMTTQEFFRTHPGSAYWFENRPVLSVVTVVLVFSLVLAAVLFMMTIAGIPVAFDS